jgi:hypothetical protein
VRLVVEKQKVNVQFRLLGNYEAKRFAFRAPSYQEGPQDASGMFHWS